MKRLIAIAAVLTAFAAHAQEVTKLTFHDALERAEKVNNSVERARADVSVAEANKEQLLSNVLPRITLNGAAQRNSETVAFNAGGNDVTVLPRNDWNYHLNFSQPIYAGRREIRAYNQAKLGILNAQQGVFGTEDAVLLRVASNYLGIVNADSRIAIEKKNIDVAQKRRAQSSAFYEAGESTKVDVLRAETSIKAAQRQLAAAQQTREEAVSRLRADLDLNGPIEVADTNNPTPPVPDEQALVSRAEASRPDVAVAQNNLQIAHLEVQKQKGFWLPTVTFNGGYVSQKSAFPAPRYAFGAFNFTVPILQSGEVEARVAAARAREIQAQLDLDTAKTTAREDVRTALAALHEAETSLGLAKEQLAAAEAEYNQVFETYRAQEATSLDVATSEASLADARRAVNEESLNRDLAQLRVWYAAGALKDAVNVTSGAVQK
ncbi:MAG TPA: TolC family protein [Thermoanaerobaculia bacterium]